MNKSFDIEISIEEKVKWIQVIRSRNIGPVTCNYLFRRYKSINDVAKSLLSDKKELILESEARAELENVEKIGGNIITFNDPKYPALLRNLRDAPPVLSVKGDLSLLEKNDKFFAVVGSRNPSIQTQAITERLSKGLGEKGYITVSGLARGVDTAAHKASIRSGTIAVIANGIDQVYPSENMHLSDMISKKGLLVSEVKFGTTPSQHLFPARNRIIAGISLGVLVVEAGLKSGSLITVDFALENGREVFAVPGCPLDPRSRGTNKMLKEGAVLVENIYDIVDNIPTEDDVENKNVFLDSEKNERKILETDLTNKSNHEINSVKGSSVKSVKNIFSENNSFEKKDNINEPKGCDSENIDSELLINNLNKKNLENIPNSDGLDVPDLENKSDSNESRCGIDVKHNISEEESKDSKVNKGNMQNHIFKNITLPFSTEDVNEDALSFNKKGCEILSCSKIDLKNYILSLIGSSAISIESIVEKMELPPSEIRSILVELELEDKIMHLVGDKISRIF
ncbi:DNA-processing protein DprA [Candidatus Nesciobacter abundans]|uniref:DNA-protecting protein DprA n=1 Tax=Candidatus Nesciobacter abundans TaxID=2601668 RepID=A0A5C0UFX5_9PROT|nr:DNA-processing protein DprA [Candidatus Nesciobacter abundans]QEK38995.1 DNA-protecting protein DprA [Candidatus Nesciobacter abundans]